MLRPLSLRCSTTQSIAAITCAMFGLAGRAGDLDAHQSALGRDAGHHVAVVTVDDAGEVGAVTVGVEVGEVVDAHPRWRGRGRTRSCRADRGRATGVTPVSTRATSMPCPYASLPAYSDFDFSVTIFMITGWPGLTAMWKLTGPASEPTAAGAGSAVPTDPAVDAEAPTNPISAATATPPLDHRLVRFSVTMWSSPDRLAADNSILGNGIIAECGREVTQRTIKTCSGIHAIESALGNGLTRADR